MRRVVLFTVALAALTCAPPAAAKGGESGGQEGPTGDPVVYVSEPGSDPVGSPRGTGSVHCYLYDWYGVGIGDNKNSVAFRRQNDPQEGQQYALICYEDPSGDIVLGQVITYQPGMNIITPGSLANQALKELPLLYPRPRTAPPRTATQVVGIRTWLWVDPADWHPISATAQIPGLAATVTATPTQTVWDTAEGTTLTCDGPGTVYDPTRPDEEQSSDCTHTFQHDGVHHVVVTIVWNVTWTATDGSGGTLGLFRRSTGFDADVEQRQAVING